MASSGLVYQPVRCTQDRRSLQVRIRLRAGSPAICSGCHRQAPGYDHLSDRQFKFISIWEELVFLLYRMRRVDCKTCGVIVEAVPWADGKHQLTKAYMLFLARWARKLSWKETAAQSFRTCSGKNSPLKSSSAAPTRTSFRALMTVALLFTALGASRQHPSSQPKRGADLGVVAYLRSRWPLGQVRAHERGRAPGQPLAAEHNEACRKNPIPFW